MTPKPGEEGIHLSRLCSRSPETFASAIAADDPRFGNLDSKFEMSFHGTAPHRDGLKYTVSCSKRHYLPVLRRCLTRYYTDSRYFGSERQCRSRML